MGEINMLEIERGFDLQLFAEELSMDEAVALMSGTPEPTANVEVTEEVPVIEEVVEEPTEEVEQNEPVVEETPAIDYNLKVKFKANGQEQEKTIQDLINDAQLASNYNQKMQELAQQRKAFETSLQQQQPAKPDPLKTFEDLNNQVTAKAMKMLGITDPEEFVPDAMGVIGNKVHYAAYQQALLDIQQERQSADYAKRQEQAIEDQYIATTQQLASEPNFDEINKYAQTALFQLPAKGADGIQQFQTIYGTYQKILQRDQYHREIQMYGRSNVQVQPFRQGEVEALTKFYNDCKAEYGGSKVKEQVKAQVPKSVPIKPTVKTEPVGNNDPQPAKKLDMKKIQKMDLADIAKLL